MDRRTFLGAALLTGCGSGADMGREYELVASPQMREHKQVYDWGIEGDWTPVLTFFTPGDLAITYSPSLGRYRRQGQIVEVMFTIVTGSFTHTTASGAARITGLPFTIQTFDISGPGAVKWQGITAANYTQMTTSPAITPTGIALVMSGSAQNTLVVGVTQMPSGGSVSLFGSLRYIATDA